MRNNTGKLGISWTTQAAGTAFTLLLQYLNLTLILHIFISYVLSDNRFLNLSDAAKTALDALFYKT
jgi:hypothetical protein